MRARVWMERQFAARAAFTVTFFAVAVAAWFYYRVLYGPLLFPGRPYLSVGVPALLAAIFIGIVVGRFARR